MNKIWCLKIGLEFRPDLLSLLGRREKVEFCETVIKYDRRFKVCGKKIFKAIINRKWYFMWCDYFTQDAKRDLFITSNRVLLVGREKVKQGASKGMLVPVIKRDIPYQDIFKVSLSSRQVMPITNRVRNQYTNMWFYDFIQCFPGWFAHFAHQRRLRHVDRIGVQNRAAYSSPQKVQIHNGSEPQSKL